MAMPVESYRFQRAFEAGGKEKWILHSTVSGSVRSTPPCAHEEKSMRRMADGESKNRETCGKGEKGEM